MEIIIGKYSGFCNGVKNTVNKAIEVLKENKLVYSLGEIVHNDIVIRDLARRGLIMENNIEDIPNNSKMIIRAHGEPIEIYQKAKNKNIEIIDLTCGRVKLIHNKILNRKDDFIIIIGKKNHPETIAHKSYSNNSYVVEEENDIEDAYNCFLNSKKKSLYIVAQTTFNSNIFDELTDKIKKMFNGYLVTVDKTICNATSIRQNETKEIAKQVNKVIVIGGKNSSNTKELYNVAKNYCKSVFLIETVSDINKDMFIHDDVVGVVAGASTPDKIINDVIDFLESVYNKKK